MAMVMAIRASSTGGAGSSWWRRGSIHRPSTVWAPRNGAHLGSSGDLTKASSQGMYGSWEMIRIVGDRPPTILIISQDPYMPWELAFVKSPLDPKCAPFLGAQTVLGRWILPRLHQDEPGPPVEDARMAMTMAILSGEYPERGRWKRLPHAEQEAQDLAARYEGRSVPADPESVEAFLANPSDAEVFHFAGHAVYDPDSLENGLVLNDGTYLDGTVVMGFQLSPEPRPFVFLNACEAGRGYAVTG